jgi:hypothetical protein
VFLRFKTFVFFTFTVLLSVSAVFAQQAKVEKKPTPTPAPTTANPNAAVTAEQVAESSIAVYGGFGGRTTLNQIRKTTVERGRLTAVNAEGKTEKASYERWILRSDSLEKERIRLNQDYPNAKFALIYSDDKIFGIYNESIFTPSEVASKTFENQIWHGLEALLRYKENGATLNLAGKEKIMGVEFYQLDVTDKQNRKTRFFVSTKTLRVMMLEYTEANVKYLRKFYDYNYQQGTLVPFRSVLWAGDKQIEETEVMTISFGVKIEDGLFQLEAAQ